MGDFKIQKKNIFVSDSNLDADWCEDVENQKKINVFGFWFSTSRLDRPKVRFLKNLTRNIAIFRFLGNDKERHEFRHVKDQAIFFENFLIFYSIFLSSIGIPLHIIVSISQQLSFFSGNNSKWPSCLNHGRLLQQIQCI